MNSTALNKLRRNMGSSFSRKHNFQLMYEQLPDLTEFPYVSLQALDLLVTQLFEGKLEKETVILEGNYLFEINPSVLSQRDNNVFVYRKGLFGKDRFITQFLSSDIINPLMKARVAVRRGSQISIDALVDNKSFHKEFIFSEIDEPLKEKELFNLGNSLPEILMNSTGVALKKTTTNGILYFDGDRYFFNKDYQDRYMFLFFNKGELTFFNEYGNRVLTSEGSKNIRGKKFKFKLKNTEQRYKRLDPHVNSSFAEMYMLNQWLSNPENFSRMGRRLLVSGSFEGNTNSQGRFCFNHLNSEGKVRTFYVDENYCSRHVDMLWEGPYVLFKSPFGKILNAKQLHSPGIETTSPSFVPNLEEAIAIRNLSNPNAPKIAVNGVYYYFSAVQVKDYVGGYPNANFAFFAHIGSEESFKFLVKQKNKEYVLPLQLIRIEKVRR
jgi:hypothetical protein